MVYPANIVPTKVEFASGSLEPTTTRFKTHVALLRAAPYTAAFLALNFIASLLELTPVSVVHSFGLLFAHGLMTLSCLFNIAHARRPSLEQIQHLTRLVELDPSLAFKINALEDSDYTFRKIAKFIFENSAKANENAMEQALEELETALNGVVR